MVPLPAKLPAVPLVTDMSLRINPVTLSLKVKVTGIGDTFVGSVAVEVMTRVGDSLSYVLDKILEAVFPLVAASAAAPAATLTLTSPAAEGVMSMV